jgi:hypothetical protein
MNAKLIAICLIFGYIGYLIVASFSDLLSKKTNAKTMENEATIDNKK